MTNGSNAAHLANQGSTGIAEPPTIRASRAVSLGLAFGAVSGFILAEGWGWLSLVALPMEVTPRPSPWGTVSLLAAIGAVSAFVATQRMPRWRAALLAAAVAPAALLVEAWIRSGFIPQSILVSATIVAGGSLMAALGCQRVAVYATGSGLEWMAATLLAAVVPTVLLSPLILVERTRPVLRLAHQVDTYAREQGWTGYGLLIDEGNSYSMCAAVRLQDGTVRSCRLDPRAAGVLDCAGVMEPGDRCYPLLLPE